MRPRRLTERERFLLGVGLTILTIAVVVTRGAPAWLAWSDSARTRLELARRAEGEARGVLGGVPALVDSLEARTGQFIEQLDRLLLDASPDEALAALGAILSDAARTHAVRIESTELAIDSVETGGMRNVRARVRGATDARGLTDWLAELEGGRPILRVIRFSVRQPRATAPPSEPDELTFDITFDALHLRRVSGEGS